MVIEGRESSSLKRANIFSKIRDTGLKSADVIKQPDRLWLNTKPAQRSSFFGTSPETAGRPPRDLLVTVAPEKSQKQRSLVHTIRDVCYNL